MSRNKNYLRICRYIRWQCEQNSWTKPSHQLAVPASCLRHPFYLRGDKIRLMSAGCRLGDLYCQLSIVLGKESLTFGVPQYHIVVEEQFEISGSDTVSPKCFFQLGRYVVYQRHSSMLGSKIYLVRTPKLRNVASPRRYVFLGQLMVRFNFGR
jgi:hypothetical protein